MNTWPKGYRHQMSPSEHYLWDARNYPGTRQLCIKCDAPTGRCEEDGLFSDDGDGPLCTECYEDTGGLDAQMLHDAADELGRLRKAELEDED